MAQAQRKRFVVSRVFVERKVHFKSGDAQVIVQGFGRLAGAMYRLGISLRAYLPAEKVDSLSDAVYEELVVPLKNDVADDLAKVHALCKHHKVKPLEQYSHPIEKTLRIFYPRALEVLDIAQSVDTLVCRANDLWFTGLLADNLYFELKEKYRSGLLTAARRIKNLATTKMDEVRNRIASQEKAKASKAADAPKQADETLPGNGSDQQENPLVAPVEQPFVQIAAG